MSDSAVVTVKAVRTEQTKNGKTIWKLEDGNGKVYSTFKAEVGNSAIGFEGGPAQIVFREEQKGEYLNRYLDSIASAPAPAKGTPEHTPDPSQEKTKDEWRAEHVALDMRACIATASNAFTGGLNSASPKDDITNYANRVLALAKLYHAEVERVYDETLASLIPGPAVADYPNDDDIPF